LGPLLEENFQRSLALSRGDYGVFLQGPISLTLIGVISLAILFGAVRPLIASMLKKNTTIPVAPKEHAK
jgi:putative tricarboxylic transport membrane protein